MTMEEYWRMTGSNPADSQAYKVQGLYDSGIINPAGSTVNPSQGLWKQMGGLQGLQSGIDVAGGLMGLFGKYQQYKMGKEALSLARQNANRAQGAYDESMRHRSLMAKRMAGTA